MNKGKQTTVESLVSTLSRHDTIVVTTGAFDVPHMGHVRYLNKAKALGTILVLILHSDALISKRKGPDRPIRKQHTRVKRMSFGKSYACVDHVIVANTQKEVYAAIRKLKPHILVTSRTTKDEENRPETMLKKFGEMMDVKILEAQSSVHSTDIINKKKMTKAAA